MLFRHRALILFLWLADSFGGGIAYSIANPSKRIACTRAAIEEQVQFFQENAVGNQGVRTRLFGYWWSFRRADLLIPNLNTGSVNPDFVWLDGGGGLGLGPLESLYASIPGSPSPPDYDMLRTIAFPQPTCQHRTIVISVENGPQAFFQSPAVRQAAETFQELSASPVPADNMDRESLLRLPIQARMFRQAVSTGQMRYLHGRNFDAISDTELGRPNLITDRKGIYTYAPDKIGVLIRYARLLPPDGVGLVLDVRNAFVESRFTRNLTPLTDLIDDEHIPGITYAEGYNDPDVIVLRNPTAPTFRALERIRRRLTLIRIEQRENPPPRFIYRQSLF